MAAADEPAPWPFTGGDSAHPPRHIERLFTRLDGTGWIVDLPGSVFAVPDDGA